MFFKEQIIFHIFLRTKFDFPNNVVVLRTFPSSSEITIVFQFFAVLYNLTTIRNNPRKIKMKRKRITIFLGLSASSK